MNFEITSQLEDLPNELFLLICRYLNIQPDLVSNLYVLVYSFMLWLYNGDNRLHP